MPSYVLEIDWDDDGDFGDANEDVSADCLSVSFRLGRDGPSPAVDRAGPGTLRAILRNVSGKYSPRNASSPLFGSLKIGRAIRFRMTSPVASTRWTGYIKRIRPVSAPIPYVEIEAHTNLGYWQHVPVHAPLGAPNDTTGANIIDALDAVGFPSTQRNIATGKGQTRYWRVNGEQLPAVLRELENAELGFLYDGHDGVLQFEDRHHRLTGARLISQDTWSDDPADGSPYYRIGIVDDEDDRAIVNYAEATVQNYADFLLAGWLLLALVAPLRIAVSAQTITLAPGESQSVIVTPEARTISTSEPDGIDYRLDGVGTWHAPPATTELLRGLFGAGDGYGVLHDGNVADGDLAIVLSEQAAYRVKVTITNNHPSRTATITKIVLIGGALGVYGDNVVTAKDTSSQATYGLKAYPFTSKWLGNLNEAKDQVDYLVQRYAEPLPYLIVEFDANTDFSAILARRISERVTVKATKLYTQFGISGDYFIEAIEERIDFDGDKVHHIRFLLSPADNTVWWLLGTNELGIDTRLGY